MAKRSLKISCACHEEDDFIARNTLRPVSEVDRMYVLATEEIRRVAKLLRRKPRAS